MVAPTVWRFESVEGPEMTEMHLQNFEKTLESKKAEKSLEISAKNFIACLSLC